MRYVNELLLLNAPARDRNETIIYEYFAWALISKTIEGEESFERVQQPDFSPSFGENMSGPESFSFLRRRDELRMDFSREKKSFYLPNLSNVNFPFLTKLADDILNVTFPIIMKTLVRFS